MKEPPDKPDQRTVVAILIVLAGAVILGVFGYAVLDIVKTLLHSRG